MTGYWIEIADVDFAGADAVHYSGCGAVTNAPNVPCPNCTRPLFPALNLCFDDPQLAALDLWTGYAHVLVCPACAHYMKPYVIHHQPTLRVTGGELDGGDVIQGIELPYKARLLQLRSMTSARGQIPGHQVGGEPPNRCPGAKACPSCQAPMSFFGILDYDDLNGPLYEDGGNPVALIIGDQDYLAITSCKNCRVLVLTWVT